MLRDDERPERLRDEDLRAAGISPALVRRWYKSRYGITFQAYQRMLRVNRAFAELKSGGAKVSDAAMNSGYDSLSGFAYTYRKLLKQPPSESTRTSVILMDRFDTPIGTMFAAATDDGLCLLEFSDRRMLERELEDLQRRLRGRIIYGRNRHIDSAESQFEEYFAGTRRDFDVPLDAPGSDFQKLVWDGLRRLPYGSTVSYAELARRIGRPSSVRAVGNANGYNRLAIIIPCHRVIGADGTLTGYGGGLDRKKWLLEHESTAIRE
jgi:AraC family transcriptional regulator of adaptative response/methylated-DNA-[protein]-cysteine methyltransferase